VIIDAAAAAADDDDDGLRRFTVIFGSVLSRRHT